MSKKLNGGEMVEKEIKDEVEIVDVPTQTAPAFKIGEEVFSEHQAIQKILNILMKIERKL